MELRRMIQVMPVRKHAIAVLLPACVGWFCLSWWTAQADDDSLAAEGEPAALVDPTSKVDRSLYVGAASCLDCHRSEFVSWMGTQHFRNTKKNRFEGSENSIDTKYKKRVGNLDLCFTCHSAPAEDRFGRQRVETGTSCESCHGAAGGEEGWLNRHAVYGPNVTRLENEAPQHYESRISYCDQAGMIRPGRQFQVAKNCFSCHIISDPTLVGEEVGHPVSFESFSLLRYLRGEVRHNFHLDQRHNAETPTLETRRRDRSLQQRNRLYLVLEQFAKMEVAFQNLADLPSEEALEDDYAGDFENLADDASGELEDFTDELQDPEDENLEGLNDEMVASLLAAVEEFERYDDLDEKTRSEAAQSARTIAELAAQLVDQHDGSQLTALDVFLEDLGELVGKALEP